MPFSPDAAVFATGSSHPYVVTTGGLSASMLISRDHVTLVNFSNNDNGYGGGVSVTNGAMLVVDQTSLLQYAAHDGYGGGTIGVDASVLVSYGSMNAGLVTVAHYGGLVEVGPASSLLSTGGAHVDHGSWLGVFGGASYFGENTNTIDGHLVVSGVGSAAGLVMTGGSGVVQVWDHASVSMYAPVSGTLSFEIGHAAALSFTAAGGAANLVTFKGEGGTLTLDGGPAGTIAGFDQSDALVVGNKVTKAVWTAAGGLKLFDGATAVETLAVRGNYAADTFAVTADGLYASRINLLVPAPHSAASGNATLGGSGVQTFEAMAAPATGDLRPAALATGVRFASAPVPPPPAFDLTHTLSDGTTISLVHSPS